jgi:hypothetical protein
VLKVGLLDLANLLKCCFFWCTVTLSSNILCLDQKYGLIYCTKCVKLQISLRLCSQFASKVSPQFVGTRVFWVVIFMYNYWSFVSVVVHVVLRDVASKYKTLMKSEFSFLFFHVRLFCSYTYSAIWQGKRATDFSFTWNVYVCCHFNDDKNSNELFS